MARLRFYRPPGADRAPDSELGAFTPAPCRRPTRLARLPVVIANQSISLPGTVRYPPAF
jgi:hypothetical protein